MADVAEGECDQYQAIPGKVGRKDGYRTVHYQGAWVAGYQIGNESLGDIPGWVVGSRWPRRGLRCIRNGEGFLGHRCPGRNRGSGG